MTAARGGGGREPAPRSAVSPPVPLTRQELLRKARRVEIKSRKLVSLAMAGEYHAVFRGTGVEFESVREYVHGDDVRAIDWNVTARAGRPYVKRFVESRERSVFLAIDRSPSLDFGSAGRTKAEVALELAAVLALAADRNRDRVGLLQFTDRVESFLPPGGGPGWPHRILRDLLALAPVGRRTDLAAAIAELARRSARRAVVFLLSDFADGVPTEPLRRLRARHDVVAVRLLDPRERELDGAGVLECVDPESGRRFRLDVGSAAERARFRAAAARRDHAIATALRRAGVDALEVGTDQEVLPPLVRFFHRREHRAP